MSQRERVLEALFLAIDDLNPLLPPESRLEKSELTAIVGDNASLDSLGFLNLILAAETRINEISLPRINLAEHLLEDPEREPPETLGALATLVAALQEAAQ